VFSVPSGPEPGTEHGHHLLGSHHHRLKGQYNTSPAVSQRQLTPDNDWHFLLMPLLPPTAQCLPRSPNVQIQTVLGLWIRVLKLWHQFPEDTTCTGAAILHADGLIRGRDDIASVSSRLGRQEAVIANRRSAIGDAEPLCHVGNLWVNESGEGASLGASCEVVAVAVAMVAPAFASTPAWIG